ncbi:hypothetical protein Gogos_021799 [Gossypium gossypioides]|uniref:Uncharacterized protein n=1 Tax=Gossypium gossypioides TaxID=34282 RepID=A0A7J9D7Y1_GOSGO|nr:hypothetical protein [Gossypium gossypioides]
MAVDNSHAFLTFCHATSKLARSYVASYGEEKSPQLDDGDSGFPPCDDDVDGGNWSGGFFLLGFLTFLGFLKDKESEEDYQDSRRR